MSTPEDMRDCESRNSDGYPCWSSPSTRPRIGLTMSPGAAIGGPATFNQPTDNSVGKRINDALNWFAALFGGLAFGGLIILCMVKPWEAESRAARAEVRQQFAEDLARVTALAELARKEASTAKDQVDLERAQRKAKEGIQQ